MEVSWNGGTPKSSILAIHLTNTDMFAEDLQSRQDRAGSSRGRKGNQNKLVPTSCKVKEMIGIGIVTCGMQFLGLESQPRLESQPVWVAGFLGGIGIAPCRLRIESQPAGCRFWDWNRNLEVNRSLQVAGFWDWNRNLQVANWVATCGV